MSKIKLNLADWLDKITNEHTQKIDLTLERIKKIAYELNLLQPKVPTVIIGGTNGKGSTVTFLKYIYTAHGYKVGTFTSPYLFSFNEQIQINTTHINDAKICAAFRKINASCKKHKISLTLFEYKTLAALIIFAKANVDIILLEVGMGGEFDATNIINADVAILTSVTKDHTKYLGNTVNKIGLTKAKISRPQKPFIIGKQIPAAVIEYAEKINTKLLQINKDFYYKKYGKFWQFKYKNLSFNHLSILNILLENISLALMAAVILQKKLPLSFSNLNCAFTKFYLPGRFESIKNNPQVIIDVAHNPASCKLLAINLKKKFSGQKIYAVFSMLKDKDIKNSLKYFKDLVFCWFIAKIHGDERAADLSMLKTAILHNNTSTNIKEFGTLTDAYKAALKNNHNIPIIIFGSFSTVNESQQ